MSFKIIFTVFFLAFLALAFILFDIRDFSEMYDYFTSNKLFTALILLILVIYIIIKILSKIKKTNEEKDFLSELYNAQDNIVIVMQNNEIVDVNQSFFNFFTNYKTLNDFKHDYSDISELFIYEDGFLHKNKYKNWTAHLSRYNDETYRAKINSNDDIKIFKVIVKKSENLERTIILLSDITEFENSRLLLEEYKKVVDVASIVSKTDLKGKITYVNDSFVKISGYSKEELLNKHHNILRSANVPAKTFEDMWKTIKDKKVWTGEIENINKKGMPYFVQATVIPILNVRGEVSEFIALRHDVTDQVLTKRKAIHRQEKNNDFLNEVASKIEKPISEISHTVKCLDTLELNKEQKDCLANLIKNTEELKTLSQEVLDYQK